MKKTKGSILKIAHKLFTKYGVAGVSLRTIAAEAGISHSNLIYHYPTKNDIVNALHEELLQEAVLLNKKVQLADSPIGALYQSTETGFQIVYSYRFLFIELNHILRDNKVLLQTFRNIEKMRAGMYHTEIQKAITQKYMRKEMYAGEYAELIERIKIFSDSWVSSAEIYDSGPAEKITQKYVHLFMGFFYPYLTEKGRKEFEALP